MKLKRAMDVICTQASMGNSTSQTYDCMQRSLIGVNDAHILTIRFEYEMRVKGKRTAPAKKRKAKSVVVEDDVLPAHRCNPIHQLLRSRKEQKCVDALQAKSTKVVEGHTLDKGQCKETGKGNGKGNDNGKLAHPKAPLTQAVWNMHAVAPIIQWLQKKRIRYIHSDWVNEFANGERVAVVSQRGVLLSNRQVTHSKHYQCHSAFHGIHMQCSHTSVNTLNQNGHWWKDLHSSSGRALHNGVLHSVYQQRIYAWDSHTYIHLTTTDGQLYNVMVEHHCTAENGDASSIHPLLTALSYHLSQHSKQQQKI